MGEQVDPTDLKSVSHLGSASSILVPSTMEDIKFKVFSSPWTIKFVKNVFTQLEDGREVWAFGITEPSTRKISISTKTEDGVVIPLSELKLTILHEIVHSFLVTGQYLQSNADEPLVEWLARCVNQLINSNLIDKIKNLGKENKKEK